MDRGVKKDECILHPLIHTFPFWNSAQDVEKKKTEPRTPHFFSLNQDIVALSQDGKCRLKYVIYSLVKLGKKAEPKLRNVF